LSGVRAWGPGYLHRCRDGDGAAATEPEPPPDPCKHAVPPKPPAKQDDDQKQFNITFAADNMRLDTGADSPNALSKPQGLDLDNTCSCGVADAAPSCEAPAGSQSQCDKDDQGRDNVAGGLLQIALAQLRDLGPEGIYQNIHKGFYTVLFSVTAWNGTPNDDQVGVAVFMSPGVDNPKDENVNLIPPNFDGNDHWKLDEGSIQDGQNHLGQTCEFPTLCQPTALDAYAYVSNGKLVAHFESVPFGFGTGPSRVAIPFNSAVLVASLTGTEPNFRLEGELAGRWPAEAIIKGIANAAVVDHQTDAATAICTQPAGYTIFRTEICKAADLAGKQADDKHGKPCTALSQAMRFTAGPAKLGPVTASSEALTNNGVCPPDLDTTCPK
jgi:hypothetical protein